MRERKREWQALDQRLGQNPLKNMPEGKKKKAKHTGKFISWFSRRDNLQDVPIDTWQREEH